MDLFRKQNKKKIQNSHLRMKGVALSRIRLTNSN